MQQLRFFEELDVLHTSAYVSIRQHTRDLEYAVRQLRFFEELDVLQARRREV